MSYTSEELHHVKSTLGRFYAQVGNPSKVDMRRYQEASRIMQRMIDDLAVGDLGDDNALSDLTVDEVKRRVREGEISVDDAVAAEEGGKNRVTLMRWLEEYGDES